MAIAPPPEAPAPPEAAAAPSGAAPAAGGAIVFVVNPNSGGGGRAGANAALWAAAAAEFGFRPELVLAESPAAAAAAAAAAHESGAAAIFGCGGDGTLNAIMQGLPVGSAVALGAAPIGTANVWAEELGLPENHVLAVRAQLAAIGRPLMIDSGRISTADGAQRRFLLMAGIGLDADATRVADPQLKRMVGKAAYLAAAARVLRGGPPALSLSFDGGPFEPVSAGMITIGNTRRYAAITDITYQASAVDGLLDCVIFEGGPLQAAAEALLSLARMHTGLPGVSYRRFSRLEISSADETPCQIDGEYVASTPQAVTLDPAGLKVLAPQQDIPLLQGRQPPAGA